MGIRVLCLPEKNHTSPSWCISCSWRSTPSKLGFVKKFCPSGIFYPHWIRHLCFPPRSPFILDHVPGDIGVDRAFGESRGEEGSCEYIWWRRVCVCVCNHLHVVFYFAAPLLCKALTSRNSPAALGPASADIGTQRCKTTGPVGKPKISSALSSGIRCMREEKRAFAGAETGAVLLVSLQESDA